MNLSNLARIMPRTAAEVATVIVIFVVGVVVGSEVQPAPADWLGFAGALVGASVTVAGSVYVLDRERNRTQREQRELLEALLVDVETECIPFRMANEEALKERTGKTAIRQAGDLQAAVDRLHDFRRMMDLKSVKMMKVADAIDEVVPDPELADQARAVGRYPSSADFGGLNAIGHELMEKTAEVRRILRG